MGTVAQGGTIRLTVQFYEYIGGSPFDATNVSLSIVSPSDVAVAGSPFDYPGEAVREGPGFYSYSWDAPEDAQLGNYVATWTGDIHSHTSTGIEVFEVVAQGTNPSAGAGGILSEDYELTFAGIFEPLYVDPEPLVGMFPGITTLDAAEQVYIFSVEMQKFFAPNEPNDLALEYIFAAAACALGRLYDPVGIGNGGMNGAGAMVMLGDLQVRNGTNPNSNLTNASLSRANATTWCELAVALRKELTRTKAGMRSAVKASIYCNPMPARHIKRWER